MNSKRNPGKWVEGPWGRERSRIEMGVPYAEDDEEKRGRPCRRELG